jgi:hypothetical protein
VVDEQVAWPERGDDDASEGMEDGIAAFGGVAWEEAVIAAALEVAIGPGFGLGVGNGDDPAGAG